jgi:hypothetical protein
MVTLGQGTSARALRCLSSATSWNDYFSRRFMWLQNQAQAAACSTGIPLNGP